jgi:hypothetical protein
MGFYISKIMKRGYVRLYRKSINSLVFNNEKCWKLWTWCLMRANFEEKEVLLGRKKLILKKGQFIMGGIKAEELLDIARTTIYYWLDFMVKEKMIDIKKTNKYTIITIRNWDDYQALDIKKTSNDTTNGQQMDTDKNNKELINNKEYSKSKDLPHTPLNELTYEPLIGNKTNGAFLDRARLKKGKPPMLKKDPTTWNIINKYRIQYKYITGKEPTVGDADYFHILSVSKKMSPEDMESMIIWYVKLENQKFNSHPSLKSIFTVENINKFNLSK